MDNPELLERIELYTDKFWWSIQNDSIRQAVSAIVERQQLEEMKAKEKAKKALKNMIIKYNEKKTLLNFNDQMKGSGLFCVDLLHE